MSPATDEEFRAEVREWLEVNLSGEFAELVGVGGPGHEHEFVAQRLAWEQRLGEGGWIGLGWPAADGGRELSWAQQVIFYEEYARAGAPGRAGHIGEQLLGPTLLMYGTPEQKARFLPGILAGTQIWCQGYSEPGAGSDLAAVRTRAELRGDEWHVDGQKVWTSLAQFSDWCFVLARTDPTQQRHRGLSYLLVPMRQPGIEIRPIVQLTGTSEFNEVFFDDARTARENLVGHAGDGWRVAMGTLAVERGVSTFGQQLGFAREYEAVLAAARANGSIGEPAIADRLVDSWIGLQVMRHTAVATFGAPAGVTPGFEANISKLLWAPWHQELGELAVDVAGPAATQVGPDYALTDAQTLMLYSRADTIYGGSSEVQRNIIAERMLGLPRAGTAPSGSASSAQASSGLMSTASDTSDQAALRDAVRALLRDHGSPAHLRQAIASAGGHDDKVWRKLVDLGAPALPVPATFGGLGAGLAEVAVVLEETGRLLLPSPLLPSVVVAAAVADSLGRPGAPADPEAATVLAGIADGSLRAAVASSRQVGFGSDGSLTGTVDYVVGGAGVDVYLVGTGSGTRLIRASDVTAVSVATLDQTRSQATLVLDGVRGVPVGAGFADPLDVLRTALAVEAVGAAGEALARTVEYLKTRVQFGVPIGSFQALKHRCADLAVQVESARATARAAVSAYDSRSPDFATLAPLAKLQGGRVLRAVAGEMIQLHGGIGFTWEHEAHLFFKRAKAVELLAGTPAELRRLVGNRAGVL